MQEPEKATSATASPTTSQQRWQREVTLRTAAGAGWCPTTPTTGKGMRKVITIPHASKLPTAEPQPRLQQHQDRAMSSRQLPTLMLKASSNYNYHHHVCRKAEKENTRGAASVLLAPATTCLLVLHLERAVLTDPRLLHCVWCGKNSHSCCNT